MDTFQSRGKLLKWKKCGDILIDHKILVNAKDSMIFDEHLLPSHTHSSSLTFSKLVVHVDVFKCLEDFYV